MGKLEKFSSLFRTNRLLILKSFSGENRVNSAPIPVKIDVAKIKRNTLIKYSLTQETRKESSLAACPKTQGKWDRLKMPAQILSGTAIAKEIRLALKEDVKKMNEQISGYKPRLAIVQVGGREDSNVYIRMKSRAAKEIGIDSQHISLSKATTQAELLNKINELNDDPMIHGIIIQMPLDSDNQIDSALILDSVSHTKDVDGLSKINQDQLENGNMSGFIPCTPNGCLELIKRTGVTIAGSNAVVMGRSKIVGSPAASLLKWHNANVTVCHSTTLDNPKKVAQADIVVVAVGVPELVKSSWIKPGAVVIDVGINAIPDPTKKSGQRLVGDVDFKDVFELTSYITPVPGGVGPMTVAMLMKNTVIAAQRALEQNVRPLN